MITKQTADYVAAFFELGGALVTWASVYSIWIDKSVKGTYWPSYFFYIAWSIWDLAYIYTTLNLPIGMACVYVRLSGQLAWVLMAVWFVAVKGNIGKQINRV